MLLLLTSLLPLHAQRTDNPLTNKEVEKLRDAGLNPMERVLDFVDFMNLRTSEINDLLSHARKPGREQDINELIQQFTSIADELADNLDDASQRHHDVRKALPKLLAATERWGTELKTPPDNSAYSITRKLAIETVSDLRDAATKLMEEQRVWFLAHPPEKTGPIDIR